MTEQQLIAACRIDDRLAQKQLYDRYAPLLFSVCRRYLKQREEAEEALLNTLYKVMTKIESYGGEGSFEGWMRRIAVNEALMVLRQKKYLVFPIDAQEMDVQEDGFSIEAELSAQEILSLLDELPDGYRTIFNLYVLEGYKHREIAETLSISINTSKSQLIAAKQKLGELVKRRFGV